MSFHPFSESDAARFREFAGLFAQCRQTFRDTVNGTAEWRPAPGSIAAQDREAALRDDSPFGETNGGVPALVAIPSCSWQANSSARSERCTSGRRSWSRQQHACAVHWSIAPMSSGSYSEQTLNHSSSDLPVPCLRC